jgi:uncharacterized protein
VKRGVDIMVLTGALVNGGAIVIGGIAGLLLKKGLPEKMKLSLLQGLGLCVLYIGISGSLKGENPMTDVLAVVAGVIVGELLDFDEKLQQLGQWFQNKVSKGKDDLFAEGFVTATLVVCVGAMAIVGSLQSGMNGNHEILFAKAVIDGVFTLVLASTMGIGVCLSAITVTVYEGALTLFANALAGILTAAVIGDMTSAGSLLIIAIGTNMLKITDIKVANFILVPFMPMIFSLFLG